MSDLLSAMVENSSQWVEEAARPFASGNRRYTVRIERPGAPPTFNRDTQTFNNPSDDLIYEGPARIFTITGGVETEIGDERTTLSNARMTIDSGGPAPRVDDLVLVVDTVQSQATHVVGRRFTVDDVEAGGHFGIGYAVTMTGVEPSART